MDLALNAPRSQQDPANWAAHLDIHFAQRNERTKICHTEHYGPLRIQRPFYPEGNGTAHVYLLHPPGGVAGGDILSTQIEAGDDTHALVTTPAATKLYRSIGPRCGVEQQLTVRKGALLEWLPQETIAFRGARADLKTIVQLEDEAHFIGWELVCLGRPASGDRFESGHLTQRFEVWRENKPLFVDRLVLDAQGELRKAAWGLNNQSSVATMAITTEDDSLVSLIRHCLDLRAQGPGAFACTALSGLTLVRYVGDSIPECWATFVRIWEAVRPVLAGHAAVAPRIWSC